MICIARILGAPEIVPTGSVARSASQLVEPVAQRAGHGRADVHHVAVPLDLHYRVEIDGARVGDLAHVVAAEVHEHDVLGALLLVAE